MSPAILRILIHNQSEIKCNNSLIRGLALLIRIENIFKKGWRGYNENVGSSLAMSLICFMEKKHKTHDSINLATNTSVTLVWNIEKFAKIRHRIQRFPNPCWSNFLTSNFTLNYNWRGNVSLTTWHRLPYPSVSVLWRPVKSVI